MGSGGIAPLFLNFVKVEMGCKLHFLVTSLHQGKSSGYLLDKGLMSPKIYLDPVETRKFFTFWDKNLTFQPVVR
jgi:hypothetical protein